MKCNLKLMGLRKFMVEFSRIVLCLISFNIFNDHPSTKSGFMVRQFTDDKCKNMLPIYGRIKKTTW